MSKMNHVGNISIRRVTHRTADRFGELLQRTWLEQHPDDLRGAEAEKLGLKQSLRRFDFLRSDSFWIFAAQRGRDFVGYVTVARIPKADARLAFLYVDELYVAQAFRRQGIGTKLLEAVIRLAKAKSAHGVRLLVEPMNAPARELYRRTGFSQTEHVFCQRTVREDE